MKNSSRRVRQERQQRRKRNRALAFLVIVVAVLGTAGYLLVAAFSTPAAEPAAANVVDVAADMAGFDQREIRVKVGEPVTIRLTSLDNKFHTDGGGKHQWAVDELEVSVIAPPKGASSVTFTPDTPGTYNYYCDICCGGRANPTMQGTLIVEA